MSEDGRPYELVVESTVPVPCLPESSSSTEMCTLSLQLSTSSEGEDSQRDGGPISGCRPCESGDGIASLHV